MSIMVFLRGSQQVKAEKQLPGTKEEKRETWNGGRRINPCNAVL